MIRLRPSHRMIAAILSVATVTCLGCSAAADDTITLNLQPGYHGPEWPDFSLLAGTPQLPNSPAELAVAAPLYPGAVPTTPSRGEISGCPASPYLWSAFAVYDLPTDPDSALEWYSKAFAAAGYSHGGRGASSRYGEQVSRFIEFVQRDQPDGTKVELVVKPDGKGHTIASYFAMAIGRPLRPRRSLIATTVKSVEVRYRSWNGGSFTKTITNEADIASLISAFNALPVDIRGTQGCAAVVYDWTIIFKNPDGFTREVGVIPACDSVGTGLKTGNYGLFDGTGNMDKLLDTITGAKAPPSKP
jgi:hypothetical protein